MACAIKSRIRPIRFIDLRLASSASWRPSRPPRLGFLVRKFEPKLELATKSSGRSEHGHKPKLFAYNNSRH